MPLNEKSVAETSAAKTSARNYKILVYLVLEESECFVQKKKKIIIGLYLFMASTLKDVCVPLKTEYHLRLE